jgi:hypothetical protein
LLLLNRTFRCFSVCLSVCLFVCVFVPSILVSSHRQTDSEESWISVPITSSPSSCRFCWPRASFFRSCAILLLSGTSSWGDLVYLFFTIAECVSFPSNFFLFFLLLLLLKCAEVPIRLHRSAVQKTIWRS